jgi:UTP--glucose-1-phosphate uridylyltransferase
MKIRKVVVPVAGWGTRSLPATKNVPKEILPVYKKPTVQYVVEEAMQAGLTDVVFVNNQNKKIIEDHFDYNLALESLLERTGNMEMLSEVRKVAEMVNIISVRQKKQLGLGHAVLCAREVIKDEPFAVMLGDDLLFDREPGIKQLMEVARSGILQAEEFAPDMYRVRGMMEKPTPEEAPSNLAMIGRYVLTPEIFEYLENLAPGKGGEIQLTDALQLLAKKNRLLAVKLKGKRFDTGDWVEYLSANIYFALQDKGLRDELVENLRSMLPRT